MDNQYHCALYRKNAATAETLLLREISKRQLQGYKFRRQTGTEPMSVEFVCKELKLVILLYSEHFSEQPYRPEASYYNRPEFKGYQVARICHSDVLTNLVGVIESLAAVVRQCKQALQLSRMACRYLSQGLGRGFGR